MASHQYRWAEGRAERGAEIAAEFVRLKVDVIVSGGNAAVAAKASTIVPIVFTMVDDPVGSGLIASLARPGGNVTGLAINHADLAGKRLALLREVVPGLHRVGIMANVEYPFAVLEVGEFETAARTPNLRTCSAAPPIMSTRFCAAPGARPRWRRSRRAGGGSDEGSGRSALLPNCRQKSCNAVK
jgi:ABC-type uncharacterized transport system substrate-binding protein